MKGSTYAEDGMAFDAVTSACSLRCYSRRFDKRPSIFFIPHDDVCKREEREEMSSYVLWVLERKLSGGTGRQDRGGGCVWSRC